MCSSDLVRVDAKTLDYTKMTVQKGDEVITPFSFETEAIDIDQIDCYLTYTNEATHRIINANLDRSPLVTGDVVGVGPRYCPSIEIKVMRFADKDHHMVQTFTGGSSGEYWAMGGILTQRRRVNDEGLRVVKFFYVGRKK